LNNAQGGSKKTNKNEQNSQPKSQIQHVLFFLIYFGELIKAFFVDVHVAGGACQRPSARSCKGPSSGTKQRKRDKVQHMSFSTLETKKDNMKYWKTTTRNAESCRFYLRRKAVNVSAAQRLSEHV
jgi:hypothetical protein